MPLPLVNHESPSKCCSFTNSSWWIGGASLLVLGVMAVGCREEQATFDSNLVRAMSLERSRDVPTDAALEDVSVVINQLFGTPTRPNWPSNWLMSKPTKELVSLERLAQAAGGITSDESNNHTGLYQEHCVICHGISGNGAGPASRYQLPYPRDYRSGIFKWKSTVRTERPTRDDLHRLLQEGVPGAPMPAFPLLDVVERDALVDYVVYLSVRGETERALLAAAIDELEYEDSPPEEELRLRWNGNPEPSDSLTAGQTVIQQTLQEIAEAWTTATASVVPAEVNLDELDASIGRGKEIFHGKIANCVGCHGVDGGGGIPLLDFDDWTKDFTTRIGVSPDDADAIRPFRKAGALPPRKINPRVLTGGLLRGGHNAQTVYRRIEHGIAGTPMPSLEISEQASGKTGLSPQETWDLVHYVESLLAKQLSRPTPKIASTLNDSEESR